MLTTIATIIKDLQSKTYSSEELTRFYLDRIKKYDGDLNSFITMTEDTAIASAKQADTLLAKGNAHPMTGVPIAHKDIFCTQGVKTSCGSKMLDNFIAPYESTVSQHFKDAGVVMLGKTNMDEFAMGSSNETSYYGSCHNAWDTKRTPGGSSGGSATSVAARLTPAATATDTGGSIRQPAAFCGVTGIKPTYGRVSRYGMIAFASSLDQGGPITQTAEDAAHMLNVMAGFDEKDSTSVQRDVPDYTATLNNSLKGLTIGVPEEYFAEGLDQDIAISIEAALKEYEKLGATLKTVSLPNNHLAIPTYYIIAPAECSSNLSRYDGVRFGHRCEDPVNLEDLYKRSRGEGFGDEVKRRIMIGTYTLSAGYYDAYYIKAQKMRRLIYNDFAKLFTDVDVIAGPTTPKSAFILGEKSNDPVSLYLEDLYTAAINLAGLPGMSIPAGFAKGLPVGLQLIGKHFDEAKLLNVAHQFQQVTDWHTKMPKDFS